MTRKKKGRQIKKMARSVCCKFYVVIIAVLCLSLSVQCQIVGEEDGVYVFPGTDSRYLTEAELLGVPLQVMRYRR